MILLNRDWNNGKIEFTINGEDYIFDSQIGISIEEHAFNNSGSKVVLNHVYPATYSRNDLMNKPFKLPKYSFAEIKLDGEIIINGFIKKQTSMNLSPFAPKYINVTIVTKKEFLTHLPMDFPIIGLSYETVVDKIFERLNMPSLFTKGEMSFPNGRIQSYDGQHKTAFDLLQMISDQSDTALIIKDLDNGTSQINYYNRQDILNGSSSNRGIDIPYDSETNKRTWWELYKIIGFEGKENNLKDVNLVRVESEKVISTRSQEFEVDLSKNQDSITTPFPIGILDRSETKLLNKDRTENRKLIIATSSQKKSADLIYSQNGQSVSINSRLVGQDLLLNLSYKPVLREAFDREDITDQNDIASRTNTNGILYRYEKQNDMSRGEDLISTGDKYLKAGIDSKLIWTISSKLPIWEVGQFTSFIGDSNFDELKISGGYIIREASILIRDHGSGIIDKSFTYKLVKTIDLQNEWNYYDSLARRDKTFLGDEPEITESVKTISDKVLIESVELEIVCSSLIPVESLEVSLEASLSSSGGALYPVIEV